MASTNDLYVNGKPKLCPYKILKDLPNVMPSNFIRPDLPSKCTWMKNKSEQPTNPHTVRPL
jgi:hypothetical protein